MPELRQMRLPFDPEEEKSSSRNPMAIFSQMFNAEAWGERALQQIEQVYRMELMQRERMLQPIFMPMSAIENGAGRSSLRPAPHASDIQWELPRYIIPVMGGVEPIDWSEVDRRHRRQLQRLQRRRAQQVEAEVTAAGRASAAEMPSDYDMEETYRNDTDD